MIKAAALQSGVYARINDVSVTGLLSAAYSVSAIFTDVPQATDSGSPAQFPYITIGNDNFGPYDTKDNTGGEVVVQVSIWSRASSDLQIKGIADAVYARMHRQPMTITGVNHIMTEFESLSLIDDPDGKTRHGVMLFRVVYLA